MEMELYNIVISEIAKVRKCSQCGGCCNSYRIQLSDEDIKANPQIFLNSLAATDDLLSKTFLEGEVLDDTVRIMNVREGTKKTCVFYDGWNGCSINETKPLECRDFIPSYATCFHAKHKNYFNIVHYNRLIADGLFDEGVPDHLIYEKRALLIIQPFLCRFEKLRDNMSISLMDYDMEIHPLIRDIFKCPDSEKKVGDLSFIKVYFDMGINPIFEQGVQYKMFQSMGMLDMFLDNLEKVTCDLYGGIA